MAVKVTIMCGWKKDVRMCGYANHCCPGKNKKGIKKEA